MALSLWEQFLWGLGVKLPQQEMAWRAFTFIDSNGNGSIPITAMEVLFKLIQDELPLAKTSFDYLEVRSDCYDTMHIWRKSELTLLKVWP